MGQQKRKHRAVLTVLGVTLLAAAYGAGYVTSKPIAQKEGVEVTSRYDLLAKRIQIEEPSDILIDFRELQTELETYIASQGLAGKVSINFEYLPTGSSIGISENDQYVGASLLKLPLAINTYKAAEDGKVDLDKTIPLKREWLNDKFGSLYKKGEGYEISNREAVKQALIHSDNTAALMLFETISRAQGTDTPSVLGFIDANYAETPSHEVKIDSRSYSSIMKCLYFACYLDKGHSQELLSYLVQSPHTNRLKRDIPDSVKVAHKIGVFNADTQSDCGIVYLSSRHYVLCVMVKGSEAQADTAIGDLSGIIYRYLDPSKIEQ